MNTDHNRNDGEPAQVGRTLKLIAMSIVFVWLILLVGVGIVAALGQYGSSTNWTRWSSVGDAFGALNSVVSGLALAAVVITLWMQHKALRTQQSELALQRLALSQAQSELHRTAEASLRKLHVDLIQLAMDDPQLAAVWPSFGNGLSEDRNRQYLYANLILQQAWLQLRITDFTELELQRHLRYLFKSPLMRDYWRDTAEARASILVPGTSEFKFDRMADEICTEYESVLACAKAEWGTEGSASDKARPRDGWEALNAQPVPEAA